MVAYQPFFYIARLVLETSTPLSIASGQTDGIADNLIVRDANGLPAIPGSSFAGVLRHLYQCYYGESKTKQLFGTAKDSKEQSENRPSGVHVSWGCLHNSNDKPIEKLLDPDDDEFQDPVLKDAKQSMPIRRDQVKLNHRGVSDANKQGKFERISLTTGHRFSIELSLWSQKANEELWKNLLQLLRQPDFRLGGGTRRGLGQLKIVDCYRGKFKLSDKNDFKLFSELTRSLSDKKHLENLIPKNNDNLPQIKLVLTPIDGYGYRFGSGVESFTNNSQASLLTVTEPCIKWEGGKGSLNRKQVVIPASSIKGALSHRVAYYYNALTQKFAETEEVQQNSADYLGENNAAIQALFGYVKEDKTEDAQVGCLIFNDIYRNYAELDELKAIEYAHNGIDRFTGGVREGVLFFEEVLTDTKSFSLSIIVANEEKPEPLMWKALLLALNDIAQGYLALGAGGGRGHGYFKGKWAPKSKIWLESKINPDSLSKTEISSNEVKASVPEKQSVEKVTVKKNPKSTNRNNRNRKGKKKKPGYKR